MKVHMYCYGIQKVESIWTCSPCSKLGKNEVVCTLCKKKGGAMKPTLCGKYAHVICALFTVKVVFKNVDSMEPIDVSKANRAFKVCHFCKKTAAFTTKCAERKCQSRFHVTCAQRNKSLREHHKTDGSIQFAAYCIAHKKSSRRISSENVKAALEKKKLLEVQRESAHTNAMWVYKAITAHDHSTPAAAVMMPYTSTLGERNFQPTKGREG